MEACGYSVWMLPTLKKQEVTESFESNTMQKCLEILSAYSTISVFYNVLKHRNESCSEVLNLLYVLSLAECWNISFPETVHKSVHFEIDK